MIYEELVGRFRWRVPDPFNFAWDVIDAYAEDRGRIALYWEDEAGAEARYAFSDLSERSMRLAGALAAHGVRRGDPVVIALPVTPERQIAILAVLRLGALAIPCAGDLPAPELLARAAHAGAAALIAVSASAGEVPAARASCPTLRAFLSVDRRPLSGWTPLAEAVAGGSRALERVRTSCDEPAICFYDRGGSGERRAILQTHAYTFAQRFAAEYWLDARRTELHWTTLPLGSAEMAFGFFAPWSLGVPVLVAGGGLDGPRVIALLERHDVATWCASPALYRTLLARGVRGNALPRLRHCTAVGGAVDRELVHAWKEATGLAIHGGYGIMEANLLVANVVGLPIRPGSMGKPFPGHDVRVIDEHGAEVPPGASGEVALYGNPPTLFREYWKSPAATAAKRGAAVWRTGDRAFRDEQGYFWFADDRAERCPTRCGRSGDVSVEIAGKRRSQS